MLTMLVFLVAVPLHFAIGYRATWILPGLALMLGIGFVFAGVISHRYLHALFGALIAAGAFMHFAYRARRASSEQNAPTNESQAHIQMEARSNPESSSSLHQHKAVDEA